MGPMGIEKTFNWFIGEMMSQSNYRTLGEDTPAAKEGRGCSVPPWLKDIEMIRSHVGKYHLQL